MRPLLYGSHQLFILVIYFVGDLNDPSYIDPCCILYIFSQLGEIYVVNFVYCNCVSPKIDLRRKHQALMKLQHSISLLSFCCEDNIQSFSPKFLKKEGVGSEKNECRGRLKEFLPQIFAWGGLTRLLVKKRFLKIKHLFEGSISNVDHGLFQPKNQLMFSFVTFWFC